MMPKTPIAKPLSSSMASLLAFTPSRSISTALPIASFTTTHQSTHSIFFTNNRHNFNTPLLSVSSPRRLLSSPPEGKHVRDDYIVKNHSRKEVEEITRGERNVPLLIGFYARWCGPCILMAQELETLAVEYKDEVIVVKVDTDLEYEFAGDMQVRGLPTLYFISPDLTKDAIRTEGLIPLQMMKDIINNDM